MAIAGIGMGVQRLYQCTKEEKNVIETPKYLESRLAQVLDITDALVGITLVVLGVLALYSIMPMPAGWAPIGAFSAISAGTVNILASALKACQACKTQYQAYKQIPEGNENEKTI